MQRSPSTYRYLMSFYHVIKLFINLFVFLLSAWGEDESRLELRALAALVLLLVQCLPGPTTTGNRVGKHKHEGMERWVVGADDRDEVMGGVGWVKEEEREKEREERKVR